MERIAPPSISHLILDLESRINSKSPLPLSRDAAEFMSGAPLFRFPLVRFLAVVF